MQDENQGSSVPPNPNQSAEPTPSLGSTVGPSTSVPNDPVPVSAPPPSSPVSPVPPVLPAPPTPGGTIDPLAAPPTQPLATGGIQMPQPTAAAVSYGGFWIRFVASMIDGFILGIVNWIIIGVAMTIGLFSFSSFFPTSATVVSNSDTISPFWWFTGPFLILNLIVAVLNYGYYVVLTGLYGATLGKRVLGLRVVDASGQKIGIPKAALREIVGKFVSGLVFSLGYLWVAFDEKKQGWHDKIAGTFVVKVR